MKPFYLLLLIFCSNLVASSDFTADYIGDVDQYNIVYNLYSETADSQLKKLLEDAPERVMVMKNVDQEEYQCVMPVVERVSQKMIEEYRGPTPAQLIQPLTDEKIISLYSGNGYWLYDLAHGRYILQYHENRENKERTEYSLGNFRADQVQHDIKSFDQLKPPKTKIREIDYAYYPVHYRHGTPCDLTNRPRETTVMYVCYEMAKHAVYSISEVSTCNYEVIVLTNLLCAHPAFQPVVTPEHDITCYASARQAIAKPKNLRDLDKLVFAEMFEQYSKNADSSTAPHKSAVFNKLVSPDVGNTFGKGRGPVPLEDPKPIAEGLNNLLKDDLKKLIDVYLQSKNPDSLLPALRRIEGEITEDDFQMIDDFWAGKSCFIGGQGYWKYEFCYNGKITQFHVEEYKRTKEVVLGEFNAERHKLWMAEHENHRVYKKKGVVTEVAYKYDNGDYCEESEEKRHVLVRIKCRMPSEDVPLNVVLLSVSESNVCQYILTLESTLLCEGMQLIDDSAKLDVEALQTKYRGTTLKEIRHTIQDVAKKGKRDMGGKSDAVKSAGGVPKKTKPTVPPPTV